MALTTTTVCLPAATRPATMEAVRLIAVGSSTDVPPNFITTRLMRCSCPQGLKPTSISNPSGRAETVLIEIFHCRLDLGARDGVRLPSLRTSGRLPPVAGDRLQLSEAGEQLCVQDRRAGGSAHRVMREQHELPVKQAAGAQAAHCHSHSSLPIAV